MVNIEILNMVIKNDEDIHQIILTNLSNMESFICGEDIETPQNTRFISITLHNKYLIINVKRILLNGQLIEDKDDDYLLSTDELLLFQNSSFNNRFKQIKNYFVNISEFDIDLVDLTPQQ